MMCRVISHNMCPCYVHTHFITYCTYTAVGGDSSILEEASRLSDLSQDQIDLLLNHSNEIQKLLRRWQAQQSEDESTSAPWTREDKLRKSIHDLVDTEGDYVRVCPHHSAELSI